MESVLEHGHEVVALVRSAEGKLINDLRITYVYGDITDPLSLSGIMNGCEVVIHLVGIIREVPRKGITMNRIHVEGTRNIVTETKKTGINRFLHMSALGVKENSRVAYHQSKWEAEQIVRESGLSYTIFRPSVIFGEGGPGPNFVDQLRDLVKNAPIVPVIGDGSSLLQPVSVKNVADGFAKGLELKQTIGKTYELGGPEQISYLKILSLIADSLDKRLKKIHVPITLMKYIVPIMGKIPQFPITNDQLTMLLEGNITSKAETYYNDFGLQPIPFEI